jgi:hypothetical protein
MFDLSSTVHRSGALRHPKGHKCDHTLTERIAKVSAGIIGQEKRLLDYKKTVPAKPLKQGLLQYIKKNAWEKE